MIDTYGNDWFAHREAPKDWIDKHNDPPVTEAQILKAIEAINSGTYPKPPVYSDFPEDS